MHRRAWAVSAVTALAAATMLVQSGRLDAQAPTAGDVGTGLNILSIPASAFQMRNFDSIGTDAAGYHINSGAFIFARAPVQLPTGALIVELRLFAYDVDPAQNVGASLRRLTGFGTATGCSTCPAPVPPDVQLIASVTSSGVPGYQYPRWVLDPNHTIDNFVERGGGQYEVVVTVPASSATTMGFRGVELFWKRQISPAPATASFVDVPPSYVFFREIEALKESGITLGCPGTVPQFCPEATLTRAQMAAFLARALGLYWQY